MRNQHERTVASAHTILGMVVQNRSGVRKVVTRVSSSSVYWVHVVCGRESKREYETDYNTFINTHFVVAPSKLNARDVTAA
jgi:hypothetical protein